MVAITKSNPALAAKFVSVIPMGRPAEMEEVASMVSYLASAEASFVTGQVISVKRRQHDALGPRMGEPSFSAPPPRSSRERSGRLPCPTGPRSPYTWWDGSIYATADMCTHGEASLSEEGIITGKTVECTFHFGTFDVTTGEPTGMPCEIP